MNRLVTDVTRITASAVKPRHIEAWTSEREEGIEMRSRVTNRQKAGIAVWGLLWLVSAAALLQLYLKLSI
jgi:hypothetical protein